MNEIFEELQTMWDGTDKTSLDSFIDTIVHAREKTLVGIGAGRMGYSLQSFIMRLSHLGYTAYMIGDTTLPRVDSETIAIVNSSSGETPSIKLYVEQCRQAGVYIVAFTTNPQSSIAALADLVVSVPSIDSHQLMKTIYEQYSFVLFDYIAGSILGLAEVKVSWVEKNHSILE